MATWLFQGNPDLFDLDGYLQAQDVICWMVNQRSSEEDLNIGDHVFIWKAAGRQKGESGVVALARVLQPPSVRHEDPAALPFWKVHADETARLRVELQVLRRANGRELIQKDWCVNDPILSSLPILRIANQTNYLLSEDHAARLKALWRNTGRPWNRAESIAGLWAYHLTYSQPISKGPDSEVARVAVRVGRAVTGVYNKVMNFRSLDSRDERKGLSGAGEIDRTIWAEFFDPSTGHLRGDLLEAEFKKFWGGLAEVEREVSAEPPSSQSTASEQSKSRRLSKSQGRLVDSEVRRSIERRAVTLAIMHYEAAGYSVEDTGAYESFDLRCKSAESEIRVEVKGTTGFGERIQVTANEIHHAKLGLTRVDLFLVTKIQVLRSPEGPHALGGEVRVIESWIPRDEHLQPHSFYYSVPEEI